MELRIEPQYNNVPIVTSAVEKLESVAYVWLYFGYPSRVWDPVTFLSYGFFRIIVYEQACIWTACLAISVVCFLYVG
jgi:hypothetical protein